MKITRVILVAVLGTCAPQTQAHQPSFQECIEGSEFILHAAMSRDSGTSRDDFVGRVHAPRGREHFQHRRRPRRYG